MSTTSPPTSPRPTTRAAAASRYTPVYPDVPIDLRLDANEGQAPPIDLAAITRAAGDEALRRYPNAAPLEALLAARFGVDPYRTIVTAGGDEAIDRACRAFLEPGRELVLPTPTFEMIPRYAALAGASVLTVPWRRGPYPIDAVLAQTSPRTAMITVVSPNNPTGATASRSDLQRLSAASPHALILLDAAYAEFADDDLTSTALSLPNVLVIRTFSKAYGLAGLRIGYAIGPEPVIAVLRATAGPYPTSGLGVAIASAALQTGPGWMPAVLDRVRAERRDLAALLHEIGATADASQGNFVLAEFPDGNAVWQALARRGIGVRKLGPASGIPGALRITCPADAAAFTRLCTGLRAAAAETHNATPESPRTGARP